MRWEELSWDKVRRAQMRWSVGCEECSVKCEVWSLECEGSSEKWEVWSVDCEVWSAKIAVWSVKCGVLRVQCGVLRVQCEVKCWLRRVQCEECSVKGGVWSVQCRVWRLQWEVRSAKWSFKCDMWNKTPLSQSARTHGLGWRTAHASSIDEKGLIYIFKATSALPRAGTTGNDWLKIIDPQKIPKMDRRLTEHKTAWSNAISGSMGCNMSHVTLGGHQRITILHHIGGL